MKEIRVATNRLCGMVAGRRGEIYRREEGRAGAMSLSM